ncbi:MAG TPA: tRNA pseudouridine(55) synthase TruB, partial [Chloroflexi bacterium]|nr:tRNA pseudouridine(55) synthase TruB [Chloroflexota bacterium]
FLMRSPKVYRARIRLGVSTDTYDAEGQVVRSVPEVSVTREEVEEALEAFKGVIEQVPPMYSAIKVGGKRLYELARQGKEIPRQPRKVEIYRLELLEWDKPFLTLEVECSPGTYISSLAHDIGEKLGCGACLAELIRLRSGHFTLEDAVMLEEVEEAGKAGKLRKLLHPIDAALVDFPAITLEPGEEKRIRTGQKVRGSIPENGQGLHRAYSFDGRFLALVEWDAEAKMWQPKMVFI